LPKLSMPASKKQASTLRLIAKIQSREVWGKVGSCSKSLHYI
jgi:hypothetical protein